MAYPETVNFSLGISQLSDHIVNFAQLVQFELGINEIYVEQLGLLQVNSNSLAIAQQLVGDLGG